MNSQNDFTLIILIFIAIFNYSCTGEKKADNNKTMSDELNVYNWSYYIGEHTVSDFEKKNNIKVNYDNYANNEELLAKLQLGAAGYDVIFPSDYMVKILGKQGLLKELNMDNIPRFKNIISRFKNPPYDRGNKYSIPYLWGTTGIGVDTSKVKNFDYSWDLLFDERFEGKISMLDDIRFGMVPALKKLGYSINTTNPKELEEAKELMIQQKKIVKAYTSDTYINLLKSGEIWIAYGYSGSIFQAASENPNIIYFIPKEGTNIWVDNMCIPKTAIHSYSAEIFINYILDGQVHANISNTTLFANANEKASPFIKKHIITNENIYPDDNTLHKCEFLEDVGKNTILYDKTWTEIKSF
jgi:spermidine/putrescine transport system substrate-binding protein